jgi:DNA-directed RNA polymerase specialized sigma24 family protein
MRIEIDNGNWIEMDGDIIADSSIGVEAAGAYINDEIRDRCIIDHLSGLITSVCQSWGRYSNYDPEDLEQSTWLQILPLRGDRDRWNVKYLSKKAIWAIKSELKGCRGIVEPIPFEESDIAEHPRDSYADLYDMLDQISSERQRSVIKRIASGEPVEFIAKSMGISVDQVRWSQSKAMKTLRRMAKELTADKKSELLALCS